MPPVLGIFVLAELQGAVGARVREIQQRYDPKLARLNRPHLTLIGSSGAGPIPATTPVATLRAALEPVAAATAPMTLHFGAPIRFMQTEIVVLPLDPHGPLRSLHERIRTSGLSFAKPRFTFSPHVTLSFYPTLTKDAARDLLAIRITDPVLIDSIQVYQTYDPQPSKRLLELRLSG
jgi:2'-5' RNA ligase